MFNITEDDSNKDLFLGMDRHDGREYYLDLWGEFESRFPAPPVEPFGDKFILRTDKLPGGLKAAGGERVIADSKADTFVYVAPRQGHAPDAIAAIAKEYGKKVVFFMPASKRVSDHQGALFAYDNVDIRFFKTAAMPMINGYAKKWARERGYAYIPFGFKDTPMVTAGLVNMCRNVEKILGQQPSEIYCAVSTGTMIRALQIGWPDATPKGVAVARNIHPGEKGDAIVEKATIPFLKHIETKHPLPFPTTGAYDAKAFDKFVDEGKPGSIFINVGSDEQINRNLDKVNIDSINSQREWNDLGDMEERRSLKPGFTSHMKEA